MIESLSIKQLILIEKAEIQFGPGLNILTGETGAGKSAILSAIRLILGERADASLIRQGADLAVIEAVLHSTLVRRELHRSGKSRCFINDELVSLQQLRQFLAHSIELVDQSSSLTLQTGEKQRELLDSFAHIDLSNYTSTYEASLQAVAKLQELLTLQQTSSLKQKRLEEDLALIDDVQWLEGEEEALHAKHHLLTHSQELLAKLSHVTQFLSETLPTLKRSSYQIEQLLPFDPHLKDSANTLKTSSLELEETHRFLLTYSDRLDTDPPQLTAIEKRMTSIESLKRRFNTDYTTLQTLRTTFANELNQIANLDTEIAEAKAQLASLQSTTQALASTLSHRRATAAIQLTTSLLTELKSLNIAHARFSIILEPKPLSPTGIDTIRFLFTANPGQPLQPLDKASGGELSRLLFALKVVLAAQEKSSCLIFDEIDSNVGGQTAAILGAKLQTLASSRQLICVTHFVQVARCATHHYLVSKHTQSNHALTTITKLLNRDQEFARMTGQKPFP